MGSSTLQARWLTTDTITLVSTAAQPAREQYEVQHVQDTQREGVDSDEPVGGVQSDSATTELQA